MSSNDQMPIRSSVKILLINDDKELLLMCADDPKTTAKDGTYHGKFWFPVGGEIEPGESLMQTAVRELKEETGLTKDNVTFGPTVWFGEFDMILSGCLTRLKQQFIVVHTNSKSITMEHLTPEEQKVIEKIEWFSLNKICCSNEVIYPVVLQDYIPDILNGKYPAEPIWIDLAKEPGKK